MNSMKHNSISIYVQKIREFLTKLYVLELPQDIKVLAMAPYYLIHCIYPNLQLLSHTTSETSKTKNYNLVTSSFML